MAFGPKYAAAVADFIMGRGPFPHADVDAAYHPVEIHNQWMQLAYFVDGVAVRPGIKVAARWPDGRCETLEVHGRVRRGIYGDMGRTYRYETTALVVVADVGGVPVDVPLERLTVARILGDDDV